MRTKKGVVTVRDALLWATEALAGHVETPRVDGELLLTHVLACSRADLYAHSGHDLTGRDSGLLRALVMRRRALEPVQYLTGCQSFRGLDLLVGPGVLVPRPETEIVVERALELIHSVEAPRVLDLGTGSGAIALAIASERPDSEVWASDVSRDALRWARLNFERLQPTFSQLGTPEVPHRGRLDVTLLEGDMFEAVPEELKADLDLVIVNPPYLSRAEFESAPADVRVHEPRVATLSGPHGLETPMRVIEESLVWLRPGGWLVMEIAPQRAQQVRRLLEVCYEDVAIRRDLAGRERVAEGRRRVFQ